MITAKNIFDYLKELAPLDLQEEYDNAGFLFGNINSEVKKVLLALDVTSDVIKEAESQKYDLIITHHPLIFGKISNVLSDDPTGIKLLSLSKAEINVISMHTNLDKVLVNKELIKYLADGDFNQPLDYMCIGKLNAPVPLKQYITRIKSTLKAPGVRYYDAGIPVSVVACIGGAGDEGLKDAIEFGADTFVTADIRHHAFLAAKELKINLIDANHFSTENIVLFELKKLLENKFSNTAFDIAASNVMVVEYA